MTPPPAQGVYTLNASGTSNTAPTSTGSTVLNVQGTVTTGGNVNQQANNFPGGLGRRIDTPVGTHFLAVDAMVTLPQLVDLVLCKGASATGTGDTADVYMGSTGSSSLDFGLYISHTGNPWRIVLNPGKSAYAFVDTNNTPLSSIPDSWTGGTLKMTLEYPGYPRELNQEPPLGQNKQMEDYAAGDTKQQFGTIKAGYVILRINGTDYVAHFPQNAPGRTSAPFQSTSGYDLKRCNTIAQDVNIPGKYPAGDGPGGLFWLTGSAVLGAAWTNVRVYSAHDQQWYPMQNIKGKGSKVGVTVEDTSTPGSPYVKSTVKSAYDDEESINMSTLPLP